MGSFRTKPTKMIAWSGWKCRRQRVSRLSLPSNMINNNRVEKLIHFFFFYFSLFLLLPFASFPAPKYSNEGTGLAAFIRKASPASASSRKPGEIGRLEITGQLKATVGKCQWKWTKKKKKKRQQQKKWLWRTKECFLLFAFGIGFSVRHSSIFIIRVFHPRCIFAWDLLRW